MLEYELISPPVMYIKFSILKWNKNRVGIVCTMFYKQFNGICFFTDRIKKLCVCIHNQTSNKNDDQKWYLHSWIRNGGAFCTF
jgi:hypothetical protein